MARAPSPARETPALPDRRSPSGKMKFGSLRNGSGIHLDRRFASGLCRAHDARRQLLFIGTGGLVRLVCARCLGRGNTGALKHDRLLQAVVVVRFSRENRIAHCSAAATESVSLAQPTFPHLSQRLARRVRFCPCRSNRLHRPREFDRRFAQSETCSKHRCSCLRFESLRARTR